jgi:ribosomal-protein-alanine N-acetyltransferase
VIAPPKTFRTRRLSLRWPVIEDAQAIFEEYATDPDVTRYLTWTPHKELATVVEFLTGVIHRNESGEAFSWALSRSDEGQVIGMLGARARGHMVDIGYVLGRRHWGNGYMPEAVSWLTDWALQQPGVFRVWAVCDAENTASARTLEKSSFEREGLLRRWIVHPNCSSEPRDCHIYGRVR